MRPPRTLTAEEHLRKAEELWSHAVVSSDASIYAEISAHANMATALYAKEAGVVHGRRRPPPAPYGAIVAPDLR